MQHLHRSRSIAWDGRTKHSSCLCTIGPFECKWQWNRVKCELFMGRFLGWKKDLRGGIFEPVGVRFQHRSWAVVTPLTASVGGKYDVPEFNEQDIPIMSFMVSGYRTTNPRSTSPMRQMPAIVQQHIDNTNVADSTFLIEHWWFAERS